MGQIGETGDTWVVEPEPITFPGVAPEEPMPADAPSEPVERPVPARTGGGSA